MDRLKEELLALGVVSLVLAFVASGRLLPPAMPVCLGKGRALVVVRDLHDHDPHASRLQPSWQP